MRTLAPGVSPGRFSSKNERTVVKVAAYIVRGRVAHVDVHVLDVGGVLHGRVLRDVENVRHAQICKFFAIARHALGAKALWRARASAPRPSV